MSIGKRMENQNFTYSSYSLPSILCFTKSYHVTRKTFMRFKKKKVQLRSKLTEQYLLLFPFSQQLTQSL